jgi:PAS domain S-box-containing protein
MTDLEHSGSYGRARQNNPLFILDGNGRVAHANDLFCDSLGYSRDDIISHPIKELDLLVDPDHFMGILKDHLLHPTGRFVSVARHKDGTLFQIGINITDAHYGNRMLLQCEILDRREPCQ